MSKIKVLLLQLVLLTCTACTWIKSENLPNSQGFVYYLPMQYVEVTYQRTEPQAVQAATQAHTRNTAALAAARTKHSTLTSELQELELTLGEFVRAGIASSEKVYKDTLFAKSKKAVELTLAATALAQAQKDYSQTNNKLAAAQAAAAVDASCVESMQVKVLPPVADTSHRFALSSRHLLSRTENAKFTTTPAGLLTSVDAEATDQLAVAIVALAQAAGGRGGPRLESYSRESDTDCEAVSLSRVIDPLATSEWLDFSSMLLGVVGGTLTIGLKDAVTIANTPKSGEGIAYRRNLPLRLEVKRGGS